MKKLLLISIVAIQGILPRLQAASSITNSGATVIGGQMVGGVFVQATQGTPAGNANMFPANGVPGFALDGDLTRPYRNFGEINTGLVITPVFNATNGGTFVTRLDIGTASDAPERDPLTFTLEGTNGNPLTGSYTLIASGSTGLDIDPGRATGVTSGTFPGVGGFTSYRLIFPTVRNPALADSMQVGEVFLIGVAAPEPSIFILVSISMMWLMSARWKGANRAAK